VVFFYGNILRICRPILFRGNNVRRRKQTANRTQNKRAVRQAHNTRPRRLKNPCRTTTERVPTTTTARHHVPRIIVQVISARTYIKVGIGVSRGNGVDGARPIGLRRATDAAAARSTRTLVLGLQSHVHTNTAMFLQWLAIMTTSPV